MVIVSLFVFFSCDYSENESNYNGTQNDDDDYDNSYYILNTSSKKIHKSSCGTAGLISSKNRRTYRGDIDELYDIGYSTCGNCF